MATLNNATFVHKPAINANGRITWHIFRPGGGVTVDGYIEANQLHVGVMHGSNRISPRPGQRGASPEGLQVGPLNRGALLTLESGNVTGYFKFYSSLVAQAAGPHLVISYNYTVNGAAYFGEGALAALVSEP